MYSKELHEGNEGADGSIIQYMVICKYLVHILLFLLPAISLKTLFWPKKQAKNRSKSGKLANNWILKNLIKEMRVLMDQFGHLYVYMYSKTSLTDLKGLVTFVRYC